jgi:hypothetical protein
MKRIVKYLLTLILLLAGSGLASAQQDTSSIIRDPAVDALVAKHIRLNEKVNTLNGFRIQIFSESGVNSKNKAQAAHDEFQARYPGTGVYLSFKSPNYRIRIGDFRTRLDAQRFLVELTADYPNAFIIEDQINLPKTD